MLKDYFSLGFRNLKRRGIRSYLTLLGILIGIAAVVSLISLGDGLKSAVNSQFGISSTEVISVQAGGISGYGAPGTGVANPLTLDDVDAIKRISVVEAVIPRNIVSLKIEFNDKLVIGFGTNIPSGRDRDLANSIIDIEAEQGKLLEDGDTYKVVLGNNFLYEDKNGFEKAVRVGDKLNINNKYFEVKGILKKKGSFIFDNILLINNDQLKEIGNYGDTVDVIGVKVKDKSLMDKAKEEIEKTLRKTRNVKKGEEDFEVSTPEAALASVNQILTGIQLFIVLIAVMSILVGAIGIINTMTTSVLERRKQIGIMKAIGARNSDIFYQFFIEAGLLGFVGGLIGVIIGVSIGYVGTFAINSFLGSTTLPKINFLLIFSALIGSFLLGSIAGIIPALQAAKQNPVDALRG